MLVLLEVAIGLSFVFLLISLIVTALNELILSFLDQRAKFLYEGLTQILGNEETTVKKFIRHGFINSFSRGARGTPSYVAPDAFAIALLDMIAPVGADAQKPNRVRQMRDIVNALAATGEGTLRATNPQLHQSLTALLQEAGGNLHLYRASIEKWFNESMDRVTGWYKRRAQQWIFGLALGTAIFANVDAMRILQTLSTDRNLRESLVNEATRLVEKKLPTTNGTTTELKPLLQKIEASFDQLSSLSLPIGWGEAEWNRLFADAGRGDRRVDSNSVLGRGWNWSHILTAVLGWLITAAAAALGAPFWFETLQRFINIRGAGHSPAEAEKARAAQRRVDAPAIEDAAAAAPTPSPSPRRRSGRRPPPAG